MVASQSSLREFLSQNKTQFIIPVYQRNYDWNHAQCEQLLHDIIEVGEKKEFDTHFIGSIVFIHDGVFRATDVKPLVIIDGQQRLTTISLLYLALHNFAVESNDTSKAAELNETFIINKFVADDDSKLKLKQTDNNSRAFKYLLAGRKPEDYGEYTKVVENYTFFARRIEKDTFDTILEGLKRLLFVEISLERGKDDPQRIFESLNSTGLELSQADLIRNYILMGLEPNKQIRVFNDYWNIIEDFAKDERKQDSKVSSLIRDFLTLQNKKIPNKNKVYLEFKNKYAKRDDEFYQKTLGKIKDYSKYYNKLINPEKEVDKDISRELSYIKRLEINVSYPFLLSVYDDYHNEVIDKNIFVEVLKLIQSFTWRRFILGLPTNALNKIFMSLYGEIDMSNYLPSLEKTLIKRRGTQRFPTDTEVKSVLKEKDMYNIQAKNRTYFLELLENFNNREYVPIIENKEITIEHIFPKNPSELWKENLDEDEYNLLKDTYLNTIGNLTLSGNNGSLGNKSFLEKKTMNVDEKEQGYEYSRLWLNSYLKTIKEWNIIELTNRYSLIIKRFVKIWKYPEVEEIFNDASQEVNIFEADDPKSRKLEYYIFKDERVIVSNISKMYYDVIGKLFEENPNVFLTTDLKDYLPLTTSLEDLRTPYQISDNYYIESNIDNNSKFRRLKRLLNEFKYQDELVFKYEDI